MTKRSSTIIPKAPLAQILVRAGASRVSQESVNAFVEILTNIAEEIGSQAAKIAKHSGRKTVKAGDIKLAARQ